MLKKVKREKRPGKMKIEKFSRYQNWRKRRLWFDQTSTWREK